MRLDSPNLMELFDDLGEAEGHLVRAVMGGRGAIATEEVGGTPGDDRASYIPGRGHHKMDGRYFKERA